MPETLFFLVALWQETFRLSSRTAHVVLPVSKQLQNFYYYNFGDFVNGYVMAFMADGVIQMPIKKNPQFRISRYHFTKKGNALIT